MTLTVISLRRWVSEELQGCFWACSKGSRLCTWVSDKAGMSPFEHVFLKWLRQSLFLRLWRGQNPKRADGLEQTWESYHLLLSKCCTKTEDEDEQCLLQNPWHDVWHTSEWKRFPNALRQLKYLTKADFFCSTTFCLPPVF